MAFGCGSGDRRRRLLARRAAVLWACAGLALALPAQTIPSLREVVSRVDRHYNSLHSMRVEFVQHYDGAGTHRTEAGTLLLRKPGKMRWTYTEPAGQLLVLDGHDAYFYTPGQTEAQQVPEKKLDDLRSPLRFLLGHTELLKEMENLRMVPQPGGEYELTGVPKGMEQRVSALQLTVTGDGAIRRMSIVETDGVTNTFAFHGEQDNAPAPKSDFVFTPPPGVHVVQGTAPV